MEDKLIVAVDRLALAAEDAHADALEHWLGLGRETQLAIGARLTVNADEWGDSALTNLAKRQGRNPQTLRSWKHNYMKTQGGYRRRSPKSPMSKSSIGGTL